MVEGNGLQPLPRRRHLSDFVGPRELLLGAFALGLALALTWTGDRWTCDELVEDSSEDQRVAAELTEFMDEYCEDIHCEDIELVSQRGCLAKIRTRAARVDEYGERLGVFSTTLGLEYSPAFSHWRVREVLADKQLLGLPQPR